MLVSCIVILQFMGVVSSVGRLGMLSDKKVNSSQVHEHAEPPCRSTQGEEARDAEGCSWARC
uniref:Uncharacterized protein n=1 Tax=Aegilops tauschii subsp. strangulata TaxID=200361 RepID=A0A453MBC7_AEGTS